jgi:hypothetical protein
MFIDYAVELTLISAGKTNSRSNTGQFHVRTQVMGGYTLKLGVFSCMAEMHDDQGVEPLYVSTKDSRYTLAACAPELLTGVRYIQSGQILFGEFLTCASCTFCTEAPKPQN